MCRTTVEMWQVDVARLMLDDVNNRMEKKNSNSRTTISCTKNWNPAPLLWLTQILLYNSGRMCHWWSTYIPRMSLDNWHSSYQPSVDRYTSHVSAGVLVNMLVNMSTKMLANSPAGISVECPPTVTWYGDRESADTWSTYRRIVPTDTRLRGVQITQDP